MDFAEAVRRRRMVRRFRPDPVPRTLLTEVLDLARRAPSAGFSQGFEFLVLDGDDTGVFWDVTGARPWWERRFPSVLRAPVLVIPLADREAYLDRYAQPDKMASGLHRAEAWPQPYWLTDTAFATMILLLAAVDRGLGGLFFGIFRNEQQLLATLGVPEGRTALGAVALGWPDDDDRPSGSPLVHPRRPLEEVVHWGRFGGRADPATG